MERKGSFMDSAGSPLQGPPMTRLSDPTRDLLIERAHRERRIAAALRADAGDEPISIEYHDRILRHEYNAKDYDRQLAAYDKERGQ